METMSKLFSKDEVNVGRQYGLDIAKGLAIIFMVWCHVYEYVWTDNALAGVIVNEFLGGPFAAPVFMFCMGIGIQYSRSNDWKSLMRRGVHLLTVGFALNIFRFLLPELIEAKLYGETYTFSYGMAMLFGVDIMQFAGLAFLAIGLMKRLSITMPQMAGIAVGFSALGTLLKGKSTGNYIADIFGGYIWGTNTETYFPLLNWLIFPVAGFIFGYLLRRCRDREAFYKCVSPASFAVGLSYLVLACVCKFGMFGANGNYYYMSLMDACFVLLLIFGIIGINHLLYYAAKDGRKNFAPLLWMSSHINTVYCIHWVLIGNASLIGIPMFWYESTVPFWQMTIAAATILVLAVLLAWVYHTDFRAKNRVVV